MNFKKVNNITGWVVCAIASLVYILTAEKSGSFWDCGEFVSAAYKLQLPHPPGAPVFTLFGRFFIVLFGDDPLTAAKAVNIMNALASGFTILFLFWTITHFARKLMVGFTEEPVGAQIYAIMGAGIVGGLAYTFSDSFWFSAVEGEVYALSSFFTALVFWAMLKWERADIAAGTDRQQKNYADRWIIFIAFMMGLSIGVHLLNLLTIPAMVMIYYYRRYQYTQKGAIWAFIIGCVITGVVQLFIIQWTVKLAGKFDIVFVNGMGLPFFSGFVFFFLLLAFLIWLGLRWARKRSYSFLRLGLWSLIFMLLGYSTYVTTLVRSNANPALDMNNVDNPMSLNYYLGREQYGSAPLVYGPYFTADYKKDETTGDVARDAGEMKYTKGKDSYIETGRAEEPLYDSKDMVLFPRIWDRSNDQNHADFYGEWLGLERIPGNPQTGVPDTWERPTYGDNINWFITYQMGFMYWRYFMWNFAGKQNDIQGFGNKRDGNWISGIAPLDNARLGDQSRLPDSLKNNKATNRLYLIPFILGVFGCVYHFMRDRRDWIVAFLLFFFTGLAIVLYLNQPGNQPRERDYAYAGSFYAYAIWIGLSVIGFVRLAREREDKKIFLNCLSYGGAATFIVTLLSNTNTTISGALTSSLLAAVIYAVVVSVIHFVTRAAAGKGTNLRLASILAFLLCLSAPVLMGASEWDDHDRSEKTLAPSIAKDYLQSCAPNAILFTFGDNDTYPLWYAQEVEGVRPDIRIINTSLLGIDWYVNQMRYKVNESPAIDVIWTPEQIAGLSYIMFRPEGDQATPRNLLTVMKDQVGPMLNAEDKTNIQATFPTRHFVVPVGPEAVASGAITPSDSAYSQLQFDLPERSYLTLDQMTILNVIAANNWKRPIYFTSPYGELGFGQYLRKDGLTYRLVPVKNKFPQQNWMVDQALRGTSIRDNNSDVMYNNMMNKFEFGGANKKTIYFDEENRRHLLSLRSLYAEAAGNLADKGRKQEAMNLLAKAETNISPANFPYAMASRYGSHNQTSFLYLEAAYKAGDKALSAKLRTAIEKDLRDQKAYFDYLKKDKPEFFSGVEREDDINNFMLDQLLPAMVKQYEGAPATIITERPARAADSTGHK